jgi:hypothetical protein
MLSPISVPLYCGHSRLVFFAGEETAVGFAVEYAAMKSCNRRLECDDSFGVMGKQRRTRTGILK